MTLKNGRRPRHFPCLIFMNSLTFNFNIKNTSIKNETQVVCKDHFLSYFMSIEVVNVEGKKMLQ